MSVTPCVGNANCAKLEQRCARQCAHLLHVNSEFPEIRIASAFFTRFRSLGEALQLFRIPVKSVCEFQIPVETTAIPDSSIQLHYYPMIQRLCYVISEQVADSLVSQQTCFHTDVRPSQSSECHVD